MTSSVSFFDRNGPFTLSELAEATGSTLADDSAGDRLIQDVAGLAAAAAGDLSFAEGKRGRAGLPETKAGACIVGEKLAKFVPENTIALLHDSPETGFAKAIGTLYPDAVRPGRSFAAQPTLGSGPIHPSALLEEGVVIEPGAIIGEGVGIGSGTHILAGSVIAKGVQVGRDCRIGPGATLQHSILGNRVIIHAGVSIGQDGFGYVPGKSGHTKIPQIGRVIVQDDVEIGANTSVDRGGLSDTVIGEGSKIDNLVQIGHNVVIGRGCVIVSQVGIAGSATLGDFVFVGGQTAIQGHVTIADGARIAAISTVGFDVPSAGDWGGTPVLPMRQWIREELFLRRFIREAMAREKKSENDGSEG